MKYGIERNGNAFTKCANCGEVVSQNEELNVNYCSKCGAPLTGEAIANFEENKENLVKQVIDELKEIAQKNDSNSFSDIINVYEEENE